MTPRNKSGDPESDVVFGFYLLSNLLKIYFENYCPFSVTVRKSSPWIWKGVSATLQIHPFIPKGTKCQDQLKQMLLSATTAWPAPVTVFSETNGGHFQNGSHRNLWSHVFGHSHILRFRTVKVVSQKQGLPNWSCSYCLLAVYVIDDEKCVDLFVIYRKISASSLFDKTSRSIVNYR